MRKIMPGILAMTLIVVASNILVQHILFNGWLTWGAFTYPLAFLTTDIMNRVYGPVVARKIILVGFFTGIICSLVGTQIENDYGRTIEAYRGSVNFEGREFNADFLRVGRVALMFITTNGDKAAYWDTSLNSWVKSSGAIKRSTEEGLKIALKQSPPALINIPVTAYEKNN